MCKFCCFFCVCVLIRSIDFVAVLITVAVQHYKFISIQSTRASLLALAKSIFYIYGHRFPLLCHAMVGNKFKYGSPVKLAFRRVQFIVKPSTPDVSQINQNIRKVFIQTILHIRLYNIQIQPGLKAKLSLTSTVYSNKI